MKSHRGGPDHPHWKKPFSPQEMAMVWWAFSATSAVLGIQEWVNPSPAPFTGRWSWLKTLASNAMGEKGTAIIYLGIAITLLVIGCAFWARHRKQQRK